MSDFFQSADSFAIFLLFLVSALTMRWVLPFSYALRMAIVGLFPRRTRIWWFIVPIKIEAKITVFAGCIGCFFSLMYWLLFPLLDGYLSDGYYILLSLAASCFFGSLVAWKYWPLIWPGVLAVVEEYGFEAYVG